MRGLTRAEQLAHLGTSEERDQLGVKAQAAVRGRPRSQLARQHMSAGVVADVRLRRPFALCAFFAGSSLHARAFHGVCWNIWGPRARSTGIGLPPPMQTRGPRPDPERQAYEGYPSCPPPPGVRVEVASQPNPAGGQSVAVGTLVNGAPWAIVLYLNQDPDAPGAPPLTVLFPSASIQSAFRPGQHRLVARPTGAAPGTLPRVTWNRQIEVDPRVRGFKLQFNEADFK
jgi:hypothetical protein